MKPIQEIILEFQNAIPGLELISNSFDMKEFGSDYTEDLYFPPAGVCFPRSAEEISILIKICNQHSFPVYTRGAGTGLSGACLPVRNGLVLSTKKLNKILDIDTKNLTVTVESGVVNAVIKEAVEAHGLYYPPDPASQGSCSIGWTLAHGAGGPRAVKY